MKKLTLFIFALCALHLGYGQVHLGVTAGAGSPKKQINRKTSWYIGGYSQIPLSYQWLLQPELLYSIQRAGYPAMGVPIAFHSRLQYLHMPVLLSYFPHKHLEVLIGPELSYLVNAKKIYYNPQKVQQEATGEFTRFMKGMDVAVKYSIGSRIGMNANYYYGFNHKNVYASVNDKLLINCNYYLHSQFRVGLYYRL